MAATQQPEPIVNGVVTEALPNTMFRVQLDEIPEGEQFSGMTESPEVIAYLAGKMKFHRIKVIVGDKVQVLLDPYGGKGRVVKRM